MIHQLLYSEHSDVSKTYDWADEFLQYFILLNFLDLAGDSLFSMLATILEKSCFRSNIITIHGRSQDFFRGNTFSKNFQKIIHKYSKKFSKNFLKNFLKFSKNYKKKLLRKWLKMDFWAYFSKKNFKKYSKNFVKNFVKIFK